MIEEPRVTFHAGTRAVLDATRFTQHGTWEGTVTVAGKRVDVRPQHVFGVRDRSWGLRPIGEPAMEWLQRVEPACSWIDDWWWW